MGTTWVTEPSFELRQPLMPLEIEEGEMTRRPSLEDSRFRLDELTFDERNVLEGELVEAARTQRALLPDHRFSPAGWDVRYHYAPLGLLGGDYCDLFETRSGFFFLLGDVSGKGVAASLLMSHLHAMFRSLAAGDPPLDEMVGAANSQFAQHTLPGQFATLVAGHAGHDGTVQFVSAGHLPFLHLGKNCVHSRPATGIPLGMFSRVRFPSRRFVLEPGESLLLYTDGLTESRDVRGDEYGLQRLKRMAGHHVDSSPDDLIAECLVDQRNFRQTDDLSLLVIRRAS